jgi:hypothetical protein
LYKEPINTLGVIHRVFNAEASHHGSHRHDPGLFAPCA